MSIEENGETMTQLAHEPVVNERLVRRKPRQMPQVQLDKPFEKLSRAEQRVAVARDVLLQLDERKLVARSQQYLSLSYRQTPINGERFEFSEPHDLASQFAGDDPNRALGNQCNVCAIGAAFVSLARRRGSASFDDIQELAESGQATYAMDVFPDVMLGDMEYYFELYDNKRRMRHLSAEARLRAIMQNIIDNGGEFEPKELPYARDAT